MKPHAAYGETQTGDRSSTVAATTTRAPAAETAGAPGVAGPKWAHCQGCGTASYLPRLRRDLGVCSACDHHHRLRPDERLAQLLDVGSYEPGPAIASDPDVLDFVDNRPYRERLADLHGRVGPEAAVHGTGRIAGLPVVVVVMDFAFMGGSMGAIVGEMVTVAAETALASRTPLLVFAASGGARMQEGCISLMQMAKTGQAFARLREAGVLSVCVLTDPTFGGVTASFATLADVLIGESGASIGFAGPRVVEQSTGDRLPDGFQRAESLLAHGLLDRVERRDALASQLARLIRLHRGSAPPRGAAPPGTAAPPEAAILRDPAALPRRPAWETVWIARDRDRPTTVDYIRLMCDEFVELHGDRLFGDDPAVVGGLASIEGTVVMLVGHQKGHTTQELAGCNFGMPHPEGYRKALRLMRLADRARLPVVTLIDTQGAFPGPGAEERGQAWAIAESIAGMSELRTPVVSVITGEGGSGGALALAVADRVLALSNACYSVISPESCSTILFGHQGNARQLAEMLRITAGELLRLGVVDGVVREPDGGSQADWHAAAGSLRESILQSLHELCPIDPQELRERRYARFRAMGRPGPVRGGDDD